MANNISLASAMTRNLDSIVEAECKTSDLNMNSGLIGDFINAKTVNVAKLALTGLANYNRTSGFTNGDITLEWEPFTLEYDRGREFSIDAVDDEESLQVVSGNLMAEFVRTKVVPEIDAIRFAKLASGFGKMPTTFESLDSGEDALNAIRTGQQQLLNAGADLAKCVLYVTPKMYMSLKNSSLVSTIGQGVDKSTDIYTLDGIKCVVVPKTRFYTEIETTSDGYTGADSPVLQFILVDPSACAAISKHETLRYFAPEVNQTSDSHKWQYRICHDLLCYANKADLVYAGGTKPTTLKAKAAK